MIQTTIRNLLDGSIDTTGYNLYLVKDDNNDVLYVGQSTNIRSRLRGHIASRDKVAGSLLGQAIYKNKPHSESWEMNLYTIDECSDLIKKWFPRSLISSGEIVRYAEDALTHEFNPLYNCGAELGHHPAVSDSPFMKRKKAEKEEAYRQYELEKAKKREYLVNSVCDICGEHDTWVNFDDMLPCGLVESAHGFKLLCHSCDETIKLIKRLRRDPDRVRKVEKALAARDEPSTVSQDIAHMLQYSQS